MKKLILFLGLILAISMLGFVDAQISSSCQNHPGCADAINKGYGSDGCIIWECPTNISNSTSSECKYYYWFDNEHNSQCDYKQFCGVYMYYGLKTFETKDECVKNLPSTPACKDSDGGLNYYVKGYVPMYCATGAGCGIDSDYCKDDKTLVEYTCYNWKTYNNFQNYVCPNGCKDGACLQETNNTLTCQPTKCDDGSMTQCALNMGTMECSCSTCPSKPSELRCIDSDNGLNYYEKGLTKFQVSDGSWNQNYDSCLQDNKTLYESYCDSSEAYLDGKKAFKIEGYVCPNGCQNGACIKVPVTEKITCKFENSNKEQQCYLAGQSTPDDLGTKFCYADAGSGSCVIKYTSYKGEQVTWKSTCGGYQYTTQDGNDEVIYFKCSSGETNITEIQNKGFRFMYAQCYNGEEWKSEDKTSCKPSELWQDYAKKFCDGKCYKDGSKCGVNSFSVWNECYIGGEVTPAECKFDSDCPVVSCEEGSVCPGYSCINGKCVSESAIEPVIIEPVLVCKDSCALDGKCYPFGYRKSGKYCSDSGGFVEQIAGDKTCDNNFECSSNVCVSGKCVSEGLIQKIMNWFKRMFGG